MVVNSFETNETTKVLHCGYPSSYSTKINSAKMLQLQVMP